MGGGFAARKWKGEERKGKEVREGTGIEGRDGATLSCKGVERGGEEGKEEWGTNPYS